MTTKILVTGSSGLVGSRYIEISKFKPSIVAPSSIDFDITQSKLDLHNINVIVNFAAYTNVAEGESQRGDLGGECWNVNVKGVKNILDAIDGTATRYIQISTEYVFPGSIENPGPYDENHKAEKNSSKLTWYGFTKAEAERLIINRLGKKATIIRIIYPVRAKYDKKPDYLRKMLTLYDTGKLFPLFTDTKISLSFIDELAVVLDKVIETDVYGVFHSASKDMVSPFDLINYFISRVRGDKNDIKKSLFSEFIKTTSNPVRYPQCGGLNVSKTEKNLGLKFRTWKKIIDTLIQQGI